MRTEAYDRFCTRVEKRFRRREFERMLAHAGCKDIVLSDRANARESRLEGYRLYRSCAILVRGRHQIELKLNPNARTTLPASARPTADIANCGCRRDAPARTGERLEDPATRRHAAVFRSAGPRPNRATARAATRPKECQTPSSAVR